MRMDGFSRRSFLEGGLRALAWLGGAGGLVGAGELAGARVASAAETSAPEGFDRLEKPLAAWRELLAPPVYAVLFEEDTERPFSSALNDEKRAGAYVCAACFLPLFDARTKFDSGTGWPSFWTPIEGRVGTRTDYRMILPRTEYHCARCGGHQGHLFKDGPPPTGQRWCNNGLALLFVSEGAPRPELRM